MKKITFGFLLLIIGLIVNSQTNSEKIKIAEDLELQKISDNAYIHVSYKEFDKWGAIGANGLLLIDKNQAFIFDSPWTDEQTEKLVLWIKDSMKLEIVGFIPNHFHIDCMGGLGTFKKYNIKSYANQMTIEIAESKGLPKPEYGFKDSLELKLGEKRIQCYYLGPAHSMDNIVVWIPSGKILFPACMVKSINSRNLGNTSDGDLELYAKTLDKLTEKFPKAEIIVPGHGKTGGLELIEHTIQLTKK
jgi:metallo-beta-lactamase class B